MAKLPSAFNANAEGQETMGDFSAIPAGDYLMAIKKSEMKKCKETAKDPNGQYLQMQFEVLNGKYKGRMFFSNLNLINKNPQAVEIANKELATICKACGRPAIEDSTELHGIPMMVTLSKTAGDANNPPKNDIKFYKNADGAPVSTPKADAPAGDTAEEQEAKPRKKAWE